MTRASASVIATVALGLAVCGCGSGHHETPAHRPSPPPAAAKVARSSVARSRRVRRLDRPGRRPIHGAQGRSPAYRHQPANAGAKGAPPTTRVARAHHRRRRMPAPTPKAALRALPGG